MTTILILSAALAAPLTDAPALELNYAGSVSPVTPDGVGQSSKQFNLYVLVKPVEGAGHELTYTLDERGPGGWPWPERFGSIAVNDKHEPAGDRRIKILYDHNETLYPLLVPMPLFANTEQLQAGAEWSVDERKYSVTGDRKIGERDCWKVEVEDSFGLLQTLFIDKSTSLLVSATQRVFMGRGDRFQLEVKLDAARDLDASELERVREPFAALLALQSKLERREDETKAELSDEQLLAVEPVIAQIGQGAESTPLERLVAVISRDTKSQQQRSTDVAGLAAKLIGQDSPALDLVDIDGRAVDVASQKGKVVLLHFWKYHGDPPEEPYGQVGYLDYLHSRRGKLGLQVYGVAVDQRFTDPSLRGAALRQARKLREFMNISYPITTDDGTLLKKFGDPQRVGAKLPLWVLIAPDGKITHYHAGFYDIKPEEGLKQLDAAIVELIKQQRAAE